MKQGKPGLWIGSIACLLFVFLSGCGQTKMASIHRKISTMEVCPSTNQHYAINLHNAGIASGTDLVVSAPSNSDLGFQWIFDQDLPINLGQTVNTAIYSAKGQMEGPSMNNPSVLFMNSGNPGTFTKAIVTRNSLDQAGNYLWAVKLEANSGGTNVYSISYSSGNGFIYFPEHIRNCEPYSEVHITGVLSRFFIQ